MNIQPLGDYVLLRQVEAVAMTKGGLYLPDTAKEAPEEGIIVAMSADAPDELALGDKVIYKKYAGQDLTVNGEQLRLIPAGDLLAKYVELDAIPE